MSKRGREGGGGVKERKQEEKEDRERNEAFGSDRTQIEAHR